MHRRRVIVSLAAVASLTACTSSGPSGAHTSSPRPSSPGSSSSSSSVSPVAAAPTCGAPSRLTHAERTTLTDTEQVALAPDGNQTNGDLDPVHDVRVATVGAPASPQLWSAVGAAVHFTVAAAGSTASDGAAYRGKVSNHTTDNAEYVVYRSVRVVTGTFAETCGTTLRTGTYTTYGAARFGSYVCGTTPGTALDKVATRTC